jgi:hypothetical protein
MQSIAAQSCGKGNEKKKRASSATMIARASEIGFRHDLPLRTFPSPVLALARGVPVLAYRRFLRKGRDDQFLLVRITEEGHILQAHVDVARAQ